MSNYLPNEVIKLIVCGSATHTPGTNLKISRPEGWGSGNWSLESDDNDCPHAGFIRYIVVRDREGWEPYIEMRQIYVRKEHRRFGVAHKLFRELHKIAKEEGIKKIYIKAMFWNSAKNDFYHFLVSENYKEMPPEPDKFDWVKNV